MLPVSLGIHHIKPRTGQRLIVQSFAPHTAHLWSKGESFLFYCRHPNENQGEPNQTSTIRVTDLCLECQQGEETDACKLPSDSCIAAAQGSALEKHDGGCHRPLSGGEQEERTVAVH